MSYKKFLSIMRARWHLSIVIFGAIALLTIVSNLLLPKQYLAFATVVVDAKADPIVGTVNPDQLLTSYLATQVDIATSEVVAERVVKALKLDQVAEFQKHWRESTDGRGDYINWLAGNLHRRLTVTPSRDSSVINIAVTWPDAATAAALANAFAKAYIDTTVDLKVAPEKQYTIWFDQRSTEMHADLEAKQRRLSDFQRSTGITATDQRLDIENTRLTDISSQLTAIQTQRQESDSHLQQLQNRGDTSPEAVQSPLIAGLKSDLARAEAKQHMVETNLGKNHPDYISSEAEIASLRHRIDLEVGRIAASLNNVTKIDARREDELRSALEEQKQKVLELKHLRDQLDVLQNDVVNAQKNLDTVTQRLSQSNLESQLQQTNVLMLHSASEPLLPSSPRVILNIELGLFLGALVGCVAAVLAEIARPRVRDEDDMMQLLSLPLLGRIRSSELLHNRAGRPIARLIHRPPETATGA